MLSRERAQRQPGSSVRCSEEAEDQVWDQRPETNMEVKRRSGRPGPIGPSWGVGSQARGQQGGMDPGRGWAAGGPGVALGGDSTSPDGGGCSERWMNGCQRRRWPRSDTARPRQDTPPPPAASRTAICRARPDDSAGRPRPRFPQRRLPGAACRPVRRQEGKGEGEGAARHHGGKMVAGGPRAASYSPAPASEGSPSSWRTPGRPPCTRGAADAPSRPLPFPDVLGRRRRRQAAPRRPTDCAALPEVAGGRAGAPTRGNGARRRGVQRPAKHSPAAARSRPPRRLPHAAAAGLPPAPGAAGGLAPPPNPSLGGSRSRGRIIVLARSAPAPPAAAAESLGSRPLPPRHGARRPLRGNGRAVGASSQHRARAGRAGAPTPGPPAAALFCSRPRAARAAQPIITGRPSASTPRGEPPAPRPAPGPPAAGTGTRQTGPIGSPERPLLRARDLAGSPPGVCP